MRALIATIAVLTLVLFSTTASAQVTLTDPSTGISFTLAGGWVLTQDAGGMVAANDEGCLMAIASVPEAEAGALLQDLNGFASSFIDNATVAYADMNGGDFAATGTGTTGGQPVEWMAVGWFQNGYFGLIFGAATNTAQTCAGEMKSILGM